MMANMWQKSAEKPAMLDTVKKRPKTMDNDFYKSKRWRELRARVLRRDGYKCQYCKRYGKNVEAVTVHHIKPREDNPELAYTMSNLVSLCAKCHNAAHPEKGGKKY